MNTEKTVTTQQWQDQEALRRFQLISPLLQTGLDDAQRLHLRKRSQKKTTFPSGRFIVMKKLFPKDSSPGSDLRAGKNAVPSGFRPTSIFC